MRVIGVLLCVILTVYAEDILLNTPVLNAGDKFKNLDLEMLNDANIQDVENSDNQCYPGVDSYEECPSTAPCDLNRHYKRCHGDVYVAEMCEPGYIYDEDVTPAMNETQCRVCRIADNCETEHNRERRNTAGAVKGKALKIRHEIITMRAVGLGALYSANSNQYFVRQSLWKPHTVAKAKQRTELGNTKTVFYAATTNLERMSKIEVNAEIKLSILGGLITIEGSASYLNKVDVKENYLYYYMLYTVTTHAETVPTDTIKDFSIYCPGESQEKDPNKIPTHVVSSVVYGANAVFEFTKKVYEYEKVDEVSGFIKAIVKSIPSVSIDAQADIKLKTAKEFEKLKVNVKLETTIEGLEVKTSIEEVLDVFRELPSKLGPAPKYEKTSPVRVTLTPLSFYCSAGDTMVRSLQKSIVRQMTEALDELERTRIRVETMLEEETVRIFKTTLTVVIEGFKKNLADFTDLLKKDLKKLLPEIRAGVNVVGQTGQGSLVSLLKRYMNSQWQFGKAEMWLANRQREIVALKSIVDKTREHKQVKLWEFIKAGDCKKNLRINILTKATWQTVDNIESWLSNYGTIGKIGAALRDFSAYAKANPDAPGCFGVEINEKSDGNNDVVNKRHADTFIVTETDRWGRLTRKRITATITTTIPKKPPTPEIIERKKEGVIIRMPKRPTFNYGGYEEHRKDKSKPYSEPKILGVKMYYREYVKVDKTTAWTAYDTTAYATTSTQDDPLHIDINNLEKGKLYQFQARYTDKMKQFSEESETTRWVSTLLTDSPTMRPQTLKVTDSNAAFAWDPPYAVNKPAIAGYGVYLSGGCRGSKYSLVNRNTAAATATSQQTTAELCHRSCRSDNDCLFWQWVLSTQTCTHHTITAMTSSTVGQYFTGEKMSCLPVMIRTIRQVNTNGQTWQLDSPYRTGIELQAKDLAPGQTSVTFTNLRPATPYTIRVYMRVITRRNPDFTNSSHAEYTNQFVHESQPLKQEFVTNPLPPAQPVAMSITTDRAEVSLDTSSTILATDALNIVWYYKLRKVASNGGKVDIQTKKALSSSEASNQIFELNGLETDKKYEVSIMVSTSMGDSYFSSIRTFQTAKASAVAKNQQAIETQIQASYKQTFTDFISRNFQNMFTQKTQDAKNICENLYKLDSEITAGDNAIRAEGDQIIARLKNSITPLEYKLNMEANSPVHLRSDVDKDTLSTSTSGKAYGGNVYIRGRPLCYGSQMDNLTTRTKLGRVICNELGYGLEVLEIKKAGDIGRADYVYKTLTCDSGQKRLWHCQSQFQITLAADRARCSRAVGNGVYILCNKRGYST